MITKRNNRRNPLLSVHRSVSLSILRKCAFAAALCCISLSASAQIRVEAESYIVNNGMSFETTSDIGGGQNAGWIDAGDYLDFSVNIPTTGTYRIDYRVASPNSTGGVILGEGGVDLAPALAIPNTGGWQNWTTISNEVYLEAGAHTLVIWAAAGGWNINWFEIHGTDTPTNPGAIHVEAESYTANNGMSFETTTDIGGGQNAGWIDAGDYLNFSVNIPTTGTYKVDYRVASPNSTGSVILGEGGVDLAPALAVPNTGGWQNWTTISNQVYLQAGTHTLVIYAAAGGWNINWFELSLDDSVVDATKVVGYAPSWSTNANAIDYSKLTHINYSFVLPNSNGTVQPMPNPGLLQSIVSNAHANGVKVLIAVGGWNGGNDSAFESFAASSSGRNTFVNAMVNLVNQYNLDGVDIDWEYPDPGAEGDNYTLLMDQLANAMHSRGKVLSAAVVAQGYTGGGVQNAVFNDVDHLNLMAYDGGNGPTHSPYSYAVDSLSYWTGRGLPASKAVLGVPYYARPSWAAYSTKVGQNSANACRDTDGSDYWNGIPTIRDKARLASSYGGIMTWELSQDTTGANSLLTAMWEAVTGRAPSYPCN